jgi:glycosyltransferase involved in cell wall biosynthesis
MSSPLFSIVVPTLNQARFIEQTLASISGQTGVRTEIIVIDGGSTDGTREIVERYPVAHFISEKDSGQAEAINKGMRLAKGDILAWLNSDDYYLPLTLQRVAAALGDTTQPRLVHGACLLWYEKEKRAREMRPDPFRREALFVSSVIFQPSAFWTRALWEKTGQLDETQHFVLDWDWWLRASLLGEFITIQDCLSVYRFHDQHKTGSGVQRRIDEILGIVEREASPEWIAAFHAVNARLKSLIYTWEKFAKNGHYRLHKLRHLDLYLKHGSKVDEAFWQLHV